MKKAKATKAKEEARSGLSSAAKADLCTLAEKDITWGVLRELLLEGEVGGGATAQLFDEDLQNFLVLGFHVSTTIS